MAVAWRQDASGGASIASGNLETAPRSRPWLTTFLGQRANHFGDRRADEPAPLRMRGYQRRRAALVWSHGPNGTGDWLMALRTRITELLGIEHPVVLGGMGGGATGHKLVAAVSAAGGLGILSASWLARADQHAEVNAIRELTERPFGLNHLLCFLDEDRFAASLELRPRVISTAWPRSKQNLASYWDRAHATGALVIHMVSSVPEAVRAAEAGADVIVAQGTEGGGHVGWMGSMALLPMVVRAVAPVPVLAAGGVADGAGLAAALALGAEGVLLGTRFMATPEAPLPEAFKRTLLESDGHDTLLTEIPDIAAGRVWPGAMSRVRRNRFVERWAGREWELRQRQDEVGPALAEARRRDDTDEYTIGTGQTAGLITSLVPAAQIVREVVEQAENIIAQRLAGLVVQPAGTVSGS
jgi:NAD(P)H-dependent flavin oxidoreductase YrpB (nitropropane dioxygenase family)